MEKHLPRTAESTVESECTSAAGANRMRYFTLVALAARMVWGHMFSTRRRFVFYLLLA